MFEPLMTQLDECMKQLESSSMIEDMTRAELQKQGMLFAAFLSDVEAGRVSMPEPELQNNVNLVSGVCSLISTTLNPVN